jgi:hypothetical protein
VLTAIKLMHTAVWAFLAGCIMALPITALLRRFDWVVILTAVILIECGVLALKPQHSSSSAMNSSTVSRSLRT